jgi:hypothetical protein
MFSILGQVLLNTPLKKKTGILQWLSKRLPPKNLKPERPELKL